LQQAAAEITLGGFICIWVNLNSPVRACVKTIETACADFFIKHDNAFRGLEEGIFFARFNALWIVAVIAEAGQKRLLNIREYP